ncbi:MAG: helix-hairpin-helix domain-containing protein [Chitinophagales bacterium]|nr:helix-hairpin-helix domain-containing protein [Chitinophagales bacterium]
MKSKSPRGLLRYERNGVILLVLLILLLVVSKRYIVDYFTQDVAPTANDQKTLTALQQKIAAAKTSYTNSYSSRSSKYPDAATSATADSPAKPYKTFTLEVNSATQTDYERLYGIGKVLSDRIVKFRDKLGGFYSIHQIKDVWGVEDTTFEKFRHQLTIKPATIRKININTATYEELTANPYFFSTIAKQIIGYRTKVKPFASVEDIRNLYYVRDHPEQYEKLAPYVKTED